MLPVYNTKRLTLKILNERYTDLVLKFMKENKETFERWDSTRPRGFYTFDYQWKFLSAEKQLYERSDGMRYWIFPKNDESVILGSVSFSYINSGLRHCTLGYKLAPQYQGLGYATEAVSFLLPLLIEEYDLHRIEADIMPENHSSIKLIERLGFHYECVAKRSHEILGRPEDHLRYVYSV